MDFTPYHYSLKEFLQNHLCLKYYGGESIIIKEEREGRESFYLGHKVKNSKSIILYDKEVESHHVLRLELRLNRPLIKRLKLELCCLEKVNDLDLSRYISFKQFNRDKFSKYIIWRHKQQLSQRNDIGRKLLIRQLKGIPSVAGRVTDEMAYMKRKRHNNYQRFFEEMTDVKDTFFGLLEGEGFI